MTTTAANFTQTIRTKPSIFEIIAQKSLAETLPPALQKVALFLSSNYPNRWGWLNRYYEEFFLGCNAFLQCYYIKYYDSSFSENFYGLKRVALDSGKDLSNRDKEMCFMLLVAIPYFRRKLEEKIQIYKIEYAEGSLSNKDFEGFLKRFLLHTYSLFEFIWGLATMINYLEYLGGKSHAQLPILKLINMKLTYSEPESTPNFWNLVFNGQLRLSDINPSLIRNGIVSIFEIVAFFLQFLQTWNSYNPNRNWTDLPKVDAPPSHNRAAQLRNKCPLCLKPWQNPTVLPVSGYIFCFRCILKHLNEHQKCPVTNLPAKTLDIVRLYTNN